MFPPSTSPEEVQIKSAMKLPNDLKKKKKKKKNKGRRREQKFRLVVEEAQILAAFVTFFFNPALKLLVGVSKTFQEVLL